MIEVTFTNLATINQLQNTLESQCLLVYITIFLWFSLVLKLSA